MEDLKSCRHVIKARNSFFVMGSHSSFAIKQIKTQNKVAVFISLFFRILIQLHENEILLFVHSFCRYGCVGYCNRYSIKITAGVIAHHTAMTALKIRLEM